MTGDSLDAVILTVSRTCEFQGTIKKARALRAFFSDGSCLTSEALYTVKASVDRKCSPAPRVSRVTPTFVHLDRRMYDV